MKKAICGRCGYLSHSLFYVFDDDGVAHGCHARIKNGKWVEGCVHKKEMDEKTSARELKAMGRTQMIIGHDADVNIVILMCGQSEKKKPYPLADAFQDLCKVVLNPELLGARRHQRVMEKLYEGAGMRMEEKSAFVNSVIDYKMLLTKTEIKYLKLQNEKLDHELSKTDDLDDDWDDEDLDDDDLLF